MNVVQRPAIPNKRAIRRWRIGLIVSIAQAAAGPATAEMPHYDPEAACKAIASVGGAFSEFIYGGCLKQEQRAFDTLKLEWDALPSAMRRHCDGVARAGGGATYFILKGCIDQEQGAARNNRNFTFQR